VVERFIDQELPEAGGPFMRPLWPPAGASEHGALGALQAANVREVDCVRRRGSGGLRDGLGGRQDLAAERVDKAPEARHGHDLDALDHRGFPWGLLGDL
jgi:hypothetical protein